MLPRCALRAGRLACGLGAVAAVMVAAPRASADPPSISRGMTLPQGEFAGDLAIGLADDSAADVTGVGLYLEVGYGILRNLEILARDGVRFGKYGQYARADQYGRLYTTDASALPGPGPVSNPDLVLLWRFVDLGFLEVGAEGEVGFPVEPGTAVATTVGVPVTFHYAPWLRFDTGAYLTLEYGKPVEPTYVVPLELWFQTGNFPLWFGPLTAVQTTGTSGVWPIPLGFGAGYAITKDIDLRAEMLIPQVNLAPKTGDLGVGIGVEVRH